MLERVVYIKRACQEHLGNERNYQQTSKRGATNRNIGLKYLFRDWLMHFKDILRDNEFKFCLRSIQKYGNKIARFRMTAKIHEEYLTIPPFRLIVCCVGKFMNCWSKWLDFQLSKLIPFVKSHVKYYQQILDETKKLQLTSDD